MLSKKKQCGSRYRGKPKRINTPEAALQSFTDDYLKYNKIKYFRISDNFWRYLHATAHPGILAEFRKQFGGMADNTAFIPISDKYSLCLHLELKTKTGLHGRQKIEAKQLPWQIAHTPEEVTKIIGEYMEKAKKYAQSKKIPELLNDIEAWKQKYESETARLRNEIKRLKKVIGKNA